MPVHPVMAGKFHLLEGVSSIPELFENPFITRNYLGGAVSRADGYAFPGLAALEGLCPVLILNAEYDDLRPSGEAFAAALALAGVDVRQVRVQTMLHGFLNLPASIEPVSDALDLIAEAVAGRVRPGAGAR